jgi:GT2 family glycosyltransferase
MPPISIALQQGVVADTPVTREMKVPDVSITLLTRNGGDDLRALLDAVARQKTARALEIIALDSGSTDGSVELLRTRGVAIQQIPLRQFCFGRARDQVFALARGQVIAALSQDAVPVDENWLENLTAPLADEHCAAVRGIEVPWPEPRRVFFWERHGGLNFTRDETRWLQQYGVGFSLVNAAVRREAWAQVRFGAAWMSEDKDFQRRASAAGYHFACAENARVWHGHAYSLAGLFNRTLNEGMGWRYAQASYSLRDLVWDWGEVWRRASYLHRAYVWGWRTRRLQTAAELLFPFVRPLGIYLGYHFVREYQR